jgi:hypothetical protein
MLENSRELLAAYEETGDEANTPFSPEEQEQIARHLAEIKELLVSQHGADPAALKRGIEELTEASKRSGQREWLFLFMGVGLHWTLTGLIPLRACARCCRSPRRASGTYSAASRNSRCPELAGAAAAAQLGLRRPSVWAEHGPNDQKTARAPRA